MESSRGNSEGYPDLVPYLDPPAAMTRVASTRLHALARTAMRFETDLMEPSRGNSESYPEYVP